VHNIEVKKHAKTAFLSHLLPIATAILFLFFLLPALTGSSGTVFILLIVALVVVSLVNVVVFVWNIVKGIQILSR
ncbi:hypothetical protein, partial [Priestia megaterium]